MITFNILQGIDLVNDNPENALLREVDQIRESQKIMKATLETVNHQIATNLNTRHKLKRDFDNKDIAMNLDQEAFAVSRAYKVKFVLPLSNITLHQINEHHLKRIMINRRQIFIQMRNSSFNTKLVSGVEKRDPNKSIPGTWSKNTNQNIKESQGRHQIGKICF